MSRLTCDCSKGFFRRDYEVITAESGEEALRMFGQHDIALLITDQLMPGITGVELLKQTAKLRPHMMRKGS
jgi:YesN/AraC family two-component response regulator